LPKNEFVILEYYEMGHGFLKRGKGKREKGKKELLPMPYAQCPMPNDGRCVTVGGAFPTHCLPNAQYPVDLGWRIGFI
jgi:hypothetical protein